MHRDKLESSTKREREREEEEEEEERQEWKRKERNVWKQGKPRRCGDRLKSGKNHESVLE